MPRIELPGAFNARNVIVGVTAMAVAIGAWFALRSMFSGASQAGPAPPVVVAAVAPEPKAPEPEPEPTFPMVLVAKQDLHTGVLLRSELMEWREWREPLDAGLAVVKDVVPMAAVLGAVARRLIKQGDMIAWDRIIRPGAAGFITAVLDPNRRAVTIEVDNATTTANIIHPGDHVDVILVYEGNAIEGQGPSAQAIVNDVRVLAVGATTLEFGRYELGGIEQLRDLGQETRRPPKGDTYTLEVYPVDARRIALAASTGRLTLAMRPVAGGATSSPAARALGDRVAMGGAGSGEEGLVSIHDVLRAPAPKEQPSLPRVRIIRGAGGATEKVTATEEAG